jgi:hypothetical protein
MKLISVKDYLKQHPGLLEAVANNSLNWEDAKGYLLLPSDVEEKNKTFWCDTFYYRPTITKRTFKEGIKLGQELEQLADEVDEVEPGLYRLWFD